MADKVDLQALREEIESIDRELLEVLRQRKECVEEVAAVKVKAAYPFRDKEREDHVLQRVRQAAVEYGLDAHVIERLHRLIMEMSIAHQQAYVHSLPGILLRVAYMGVEGSYSHLTAQRRYARREGGVLLTGYETVRAAGDAVRHGTADLALLPIENNTAGSINETYDVLAEGGLTITAEAVSAVEHCLVALPGAKIKELRQVISHPQALAQCELFLRTMPWIRPQAEFDTAGAARKVKESNDLTLAAIASESAARIFDLRILKKGIQSQPENATRFVEVAVEASPCPHDAVCKTSLMVDLDENPVALGKVLNHFGDRGIRLCKLESRPIPASPWKYRFYLDVEAHANSPKMVEALESIRPLTADLRLLGTYPRVRESVASQVDPDAEPTFITLY